MSKHRTHGTMWKRLLSGVLCLALALGLLPAGLVQTAQASWADPYGQKLVEWGVMRGDIGGNLDLDRSITRAEFVTMVNRAFGYKKMGTMPFTDVPSSAWYAEDINIAYNAGYFNGYSSTEAAPLDTLTREQAVVLLSRNLMLQEDPGESLGFSDSRDLHEWSRGLVAAAVAEGMINGYPDGNFYPFNNITRGEVAAMLVRVIGTPVNKSGEQSLGNIYGNVLISSSNVRLRNTTIVGNLYISGGIDLGNTLLENVTVLGRIVVSGGGESDEAKDSVVMRNVEADELVVDSMIDQFVTIRAQGRTSIPETAVRSSAYLHDDAWPGYGLNRIEQNGASLLQLAGSLKEVVNMTPDSELQLVQGSAQKVTIDEYAKNSKVLVDKGTTMDVLNLDVATNVSGEGDIKTLNVGVSGSTIEDPILPDTITIRPGSTATITAVDKDPIGSVAAAELSSKPQLMAGYPTVDNISPTGADVLLSGNKPGTIYWAISAVSDGSVSEKDLISNPVYGGNIFEKQAGKRTASAKTVYSEKAANLEPDGSYYISAVLVDNRGNISPVKVAAFSTPDDTKPAFVGTPELTKVTTELVQVTAMANKNCLLYYALLPKGAAAPTAQQFRTGSIGTNYGYGTVNMVKNASISFPASSRRLMEKTEYVLYLWLTDFNNAQSMDAPLAIPVMTPDETPPIVTAPYQSGWYANSADIKFAMNEAPATLHWYILPEGEDAAFRGETPEETEEILTALRTKIMIESGTQAIKFGSAPSAAEAYKEAAFTIDGLNSERYGNNFVMYYVGKDEAGNYSDRVGSITIQTLDVTPPQVINSMDEKNKVDFTNYNGDKTDEPLADSGVKIVFTEQIKSGPNAERTFLELYQMSVNPASSENDRRTYRNRLAAELASCIQLYTVPRTGGPVLIEPRGDNDTGDWVLDFHKAQVMMENGKLVVYLPGEHDVGKDNAAIRLESGATYYFQLLHIYDNAVNPNPLSPDGSRNPSGNVRLENFTTVYAQVNIEWNTSVTKVVNASDSSIVGNRLDMVVDVKPSSTDKVPETERWDMIIWSDTYVEAEIYYRVDGGPWEPLTTGSLPINDSTNTAGVGLGTRVTGEYPAIKDTLVEDRTYTYGIHFTSVKGVPETEEKAEADSWSDLVTMHFGLIAGAESGVSNASRSIRTSFDSNFNIVQSPKQVSYISSAHTESGVKEVLEISKQFLDTKVPEFSKDYPMFEAGSGTIRMSVSLDRPGTVYYVVAKAETINTRLPDGTLITTYIDANHPGNDGSTGSTVAEKSYIPTDGSDRDSGPNKDKIYFTTGGDDGGRGVYASPNYTDVVAGNFPRNNVYVPDKPVTYTNTVESVDISGLIPETTYYIYTVLEGGGAPDRVVEVYRVKTEKATKPWIQVTGSATTATMIPSEDCELTFALVPITKLPGWIKDKTGTEDSILTQMMNRDGNTTSGPSVFDNKTGNTSLKQRVARYVQGVVEGTDSLPDEFWTLPKDDPNRKDAVIKKGENVFWDLEPYMQSDNTEYVLLVIAHHPYSGSSGNEYGFSAIRSLYKPDRVPPAFESKAEKPNATVDTASVSCDDADAWKDGSWQDNPLAYTYSGTYTIRFSKDIYYHSNDDNELYEIWYSTPTGTAPSKWKPVTEILGGDAIESKTAKVTSSGKVGNQITLTLDKIRPYQTITVFASGLISNRSDYTSDYQLTLTFDPTLQTSDYRNGVYLATGQPGFTFKWVKIK